MQSKKIRPLTRRSFIAQGSAAVAMTLLASSVLAPWGLLGCSDKVSADKDRMKNLQYQLKTPDASTATDKLLAAQTFAFDTMVSISAYTDEQTIRELLTSCAAYEEMFSSHKEGAEIYRINHAQGKSVQVSPQTYQLIEQACDFARKSNGLFDPTIGSVSLLWDFDECIKPSDDAIQEGLKHLGYEHVILEDDNYVRLDDPKAMLDLGAISKGWIADDMVRRLREAGVSGALVNLGGSSIYALGHKVVDGAPSPWKIGVRDPNSKDGDYLAGLELQDKAVVTSGLNERHFVEDGIDYWHILDPKTGYPKDSDIASVTLVTDSSTVADALSTTIFLEGKDEAASVLQAYPGTEAFFVMRDGQEHMTSGLSSYGFTRMSHDSAGGGQDAGQ